MRPRTPIRAACLALLLLMPACPREQAPANAERFPISLARFNWPGSYWIDVAESKGWFEEAGLDVTMVDTNPDYFGSLEDVVEGRLDCQGFTVFDFVRWNMEGADLSMVAVTDDSWGAESLVAAPGIGAIRELRGKRIGVTRGTYCEYLLAIALERAELTLEDVFLVEGQPESLPGLLAEGKADAVLTWEPIASKALESSGGSRLFDSTGLPGVLPSGIVFRRSATDAQPRMVQALVDVWIRANRFTREQPEETYGIVARVQGIPIEEIRTVARDVRVLEPRQSLARFSYSAGFESLHGSAETMTRFLERSAPKGERFDSFAHFDARFLKAGLAR